MSYADVSVKGRSPKGGAPTTGFSGRASRAAEPARWACKSGAGNVREPLVFKETTMHRGRRQFLAGAASLVLANGGWATLARSQERKGTRLILLGTKGGPRVGGSRNNPSTLLLINGMPYVVDCGAGTSR